MIRRGVVIAIAGLSRRRRVGEWRRQSIRSQSCEFQSQSQILKSPTSLISLDVPNVWPPPPHRLLSHSIIIACEEAGIKSVVTNFPDDCSESEVLHALSTFAEDPSIHGILVQLPLPQLNEEKILNAVSLEKDIDGFHPLNIGNLAMRGRQPLFITCTPKGVIELLTRSGIDVMGKNTVVIGRSNIVGLPTSLLLQAPSIVHAFSKNPEKVTREADKVISAAGVPNLVRGNWLKHGAVVVDVGTHSVEIITLSSCNDA